MPLIFSCLTCGEPVSSDLIPEDALLDGLTSEDNVALICAVCLACSNFDEPAIRIPESFSFPYPSDN